MNRVHASFAVIAFSISLITTATNAAADEPVKPRAPSNTEMIEAETRFQEGIDLYEKGSINEARVKLVQAYAVLGRPNILWNLAVAEFYSSRTLDSIRHMRKLVKAPDAEPRDVKVARETFIPQLEKVTGRITVVAPKGLSVTVDGEPAGLAPLAEPVDVLPGRHIVVATGPSGSSSSEIEILAGQGATVSVGDKGDATGPATNVTASSDGNIASAPRDRASDNGEASSPVARNVTVIALGGAAIVAAAVGIGFVAKAGSAEDEAARLRGSIGGGSSSCAQAANPDCARLREVTDDESSARNLSTGFFVGAAALAVGAGVAWFLWPKASSSHARAGLVPTATGGELHMQLRF